jgi:cell division protein FtsZ
MTHFATIDKSKSLSAVLKVVGVGGGGCNAIESMIRRGLTGVEYIAINTDAQVLDSNSAQHKVQVGVKITKGLGAGADPNVGRKAVEEDKEKIAEILTGSDMVFVTAGMGGGTGTGGAPIVASIAKSLGALVIAVVTKPFSWEGKQRMFNTETGIQELKKYVDSLIIIPNERLLSIVDKNMSVHTAFDTPNEVLYEATRGIADIITVEGLINVDFADVRAVMNQSGVAMMGCGIASGENRAIEAAQKAISSPLLDGVKIKGAKHVLLNVTGSSNLTMHEVIEGNRVISEAAGEEANVIFGIVKNEELKDYVSYTVIATGFEDAKKTFSTPQPAVKKTETPKESRMKSGFLFNSREDIDTNNLDEPTILRVKRPETQFPKDDDPAIQPGFGFDRLKNFSMDSNNEKEEVTNNNQDNDEESSSFLRMMMD